MPSPYPTLIDDRGASPASLGAIMVGQLDAVVTVNDQDVAEGARLDGWIDFNDDGIWGGSGGQVSTVQRY